MAVKFINTDAPFINDVKLRDKKLKSKLCVTCFFAQYRGLIGLPRVPQLRAVSTYVTNLHSIPASNTRNIALLRASDLSH